MKSLSGWAAVSAALLVASAYGCSSSSSDASNGSDAGPGNGSDGGPSGDGGPGGGDGGGSGVPFLGTVNVQQTNTSGTYSTDFEAQFRKNFTGTGTGANACATVITSGACTFSDCTNLIAGSADAGATNAFVQAGSVSISGGSLAAAISLPYQTANDVDLYAANQPSQAYAAGNTFTVTATGQSGAVDAFSGSSAAAPADITVTAPVPGTNAAGNIFTINEAQDLTVTWTGGSAGSQTEVVLLNNSGALQLSCDFDSAAGTGTVPTALLTKLGTSDGTFSSPNGISSLNIVPQSTATINASNAKVTFNVTGTSLFGTFKTQ